MLNFLFLFFSSQQKKPCCLFFLLDMFNIYFSCFVLFFLCLEKWFSFRIFCLPVVMYLKFFVFHPTNWERHLLLFLFLPCCFLFLFSSFFLTKECDIILLKFELFSEIPCSSFFSLHFFCHEKISTKKNYLCFFSPFLFHFFSFQNFSIIIFLWSFFLSSFCSSLFCFLLLFLFFPSPFFLYFSISVFLFFFSTSRFLICFTPSPFLRITFFVIKHSSFLSFDLDLFVFLLLLYPFFFISVSAFFLFWKNKVQYFLWSIFWKDENVFSNSPLSDFF